MLIFLALLLVLGDVALFALPAGQNVVIGDATFNINGNTLTITNSNGAIIHWQDFSIQAGELTNFIQSGSNSAVLNRVVGGNLSQIFGTLSSNSSVYLINPNGVFIGASGIIDTNGFIASTLDVTNEAFLAAGDLNFIGDSQEGIVNLGTITAHQGDVFLIARHGGRKPAMV